MLDAYKRFFKQHTGYPKFKTKKDNKQSCRFELGAISKRNVYTDYKLSLANIKNVKFRCSKKYAEYLQKHKENIRQATLTRLPCGEYYLSTFCICVNNFYRITFSCYNFSCRIFQILF